jgi:hypothetical protein
VRLPFGIVSVQLASVNCAPYWDVECVVVGVRISEFEEEIVIRMVKVLKVEEMEIVAEGNWYTRKWETPNWKEREMEHLCLDGDLKEIWKGSGYCRQENGLGEEVVTGPVSLGNLTDCVCWDEGRMIYLLM